MTVEMALIPVLNSTIEHFRTLLANSHKGGFASIYV